MSVQDLGMRLQILRDRDVQAVALGLGPSQKRTLPGGPACAAAPARQPVGLRPQEVAESLPVGRGLGLALGVPRLDEEAGRERPFERDLRAARVQRGAAPIVVGVPGAGGEHHEDRRLCAGTWPHDEEGIGLLVAGGDRDAVVAGGPVLAHADPQGRRPVAALRGCIGGDEMVGRVAGTDPRDLALGAVARDPHVEAPRRIRGDVQGHLVTRLHALRPAVRLEHRAQSRRRDTGAGSRAPELVFSGVLERQVGPTVSSVQG